MKMRAAIHFAWLIITLTTTFGIIQAVLASTFYIGNTVVFKTDSNELLVLDTTATLEAASTQYFLFDNRNGVTIHAIERDKPLGWDSDEYWTSDSASITRGEWFVQEGTNVTVRIISESNLTIEVIDRDDPFSAFLVGIAGILIWTLGASIIRENTK